MRIIVVWYNPHKKTYYYRFVSGFYAKYEVGYKNQYDHEVILVIDLNQKYYLKDSLLKRVLTKLISFLQNINKKL